MTTGVRVCRSTGILPVSGTGVELGMEGLLAYCRRKSAVIGCDETAPVGWNLK